MMRFLGIACFAVTMAACQSMPSTDGIKEVAELRAFQQSMLTKGPEALGREMAELETVASQGNSVLTHAKLALLESQLQQLALLEEHYQERQYLRAQIAELSSQIEALTDIEQQINRRNQLQETVND